MQSKQDAHGVLLKGVLLAVVLLVIMLNDAGLRPHSSQSSEAAPAPSTDEVAPPPTLEMSPPPATLP